MRVTVAGASVPVPELVSPIVGTNTGSGWGEVFQRALSGVAKETRGASASDLRLKQLTEMIQLQMEVCRHQVQVELVSKVAESGVATVRKLQQAQ
jgi:hypothetical protein